jgi:hypothetical protein
MSKRIKISDFAQDDRTRNRMFENLEKMQFINCDKYDIPEMLPVTSIDTETEFIPFNYLKTLKNKSKYGVHFFIDDYQFNRIWQRPDVYCRMLKDCEYVLTPDFSLYADAPYAMQLWKHYQKQWLGCYMQNYGINVIPTLGWSDNRSFDFCFEGVPHNSIVAMSSVGSQIDYVTKYFFRKGFEKSIEVLNPTKILFYGQIPCDIDVSGLNTVNYPHSFDVKFKTLRNGR